MLVPADKKTPVWIGVFDSKAEVYDIIRVVRGEISVGKKTRLQMSIDDNQNGMILCEGQGFDSRLLNSYTEFQISEDLHVIIARKRTAVISWIRKRVV